MQASPIVLTTLAGLSTGLGGALAAVRALLEFFFFYLIWGYENIQLVFIHSVLPMLVYTTALMPLFLLLVRKIKEKCDGQWKE